MSRPRLSHRNLHTIFVWDFDWTIVHCNSDEYIPSHFLGNEATESGFRRLYASGLDWHSCVEAQIEAARSCRGATKDDFLQAAAAMPYLVDVKGALEDISDASFLPDANADEKTNSNDAPLSTPGIGQMIISDGNDLFIRSFLERNGMDRHFTHGIISNIGRMDDDGRLHVTHQSVKYGGHDCPRCPANLCKSQALQEVLCGVQDEAWTDEKSRPRIVYVGDGANDACPALNVLKEGDLLLARGGTKRQDSNVRKGAENDDEAMSGNAPNGTVSTFAILSTLQRAKERDSLAPRCQVLEWCTGSELRSMINEHLSKKKTHESVSHTKLADPMLTTETRK